MEKINFSNKKIVEITLDLLNKNDEWKKRYAGYAESITKNRDAYGKNSRTFSHKSPLYIYSSITKVKDNSTTSTYDLRFAGQSVGEVSVKKEGNVVLKITDDQALYANKLFNNYKRVTGFKDDWRGKLASEYRGLFMKQRSTKDTQIHSKEHRIENWMLAEFKKRTRKDGKLLCNIQPVLLGGQFFQLATPLSASNHGEEPKYSYQRGGGIDILARVNHTTNKRDNRFAIIELKDENKPEESQAMTLQQALCYATFVASLLRSESGNKWWNIFGRAGEIPEELHLDAVTLMPDEGKSEEGDLSEITIDSLNTIIHPHTLYFKTNKEGNPECIYGTLKETLANKGE